MTHPAGFHFDEDLAVVGYGADFFLDAERRIGLFEYQGFHAVGLRRPRWGLSKPSMGNAAAGSIGRFGCRAQLRAEVYIENLIYAKRSRPGRTAGP